MLAQGFYQILRCLEQRIRLYHQINHQNQR